MAIHAARRTCSSRNLALVAGLAVLTACTAMGDGPRSRRATSDAEQTRKTAESVEAPQANANAVEAEQFDVTPEQAAANGFSMDRRPVRMINTFNGNPADPHGRHPGWAKDDVQAIQWLENQLNSAWSRGYTRFVLNLPAGRDRSIDPNTGRVVFMSASHWLPMSEMRRQLLADFCRSWLADHPGATLGLYSGFDLDPDPSDIDYIGHYIPDFSKEEDREAMYDLIKPWIEECGFSEVWWDVASKADRRDEAVRFSQWLDAQGVKAGGEAVPRVWPGYNGKLDDRYLESMPWMALITYFRLHDSKQKWTADPNTTEAFIAFRAGDKPTDLEMLNAFQRGFIPWVYSGTLDERVWKLWNQANGNGIVFPAQRINANPSDSATKDGKQKRTRRRSR